MDTTLELSDRRFDAARAASKEELAAEAQRREQRRDRMWAIVTWLGLFAVLLSGMALRIYMYWPH